MSGSSLAQLQPGVVKVKKHSFRGAAALGLLEVSRSHTYSSIDEEEGEDEEGEDEIKTEL